MPHFFPLDIFGFGVWVLSFTGRGLSWGYWSNVQVCGARLQCQTRAAFGFRGLPIEPVHDSTTDRAHWHLRKLWRDLGYRACLGAGKGRESDRDFRRQIEWEGLGSLGVSQGEIRAPFVVSDLR
ncbi:hypothetical protein GCM10027167_64430 [Nocardia heshunensis]